MIDLHCHILPGVDDGAADLETSLVMARKAVADGIDTIVATPHTLNDRYHNPFSQVEERVAQLNRRLTEEKLPLTILPGSDAHLSLDMVGKLRQGDAGTVNGNGKYLMLEFPSQTILPAYKEELFQLRLYGITPIITHPERNRVFQQNTEMLHELAAMGSLIQVTAMSITGEFGKAAMKCAQRLLKEGLAHVIATDAHNPDRRPPILSKAVDKAATILQSRKAAEAMVVTRPRAIIKGGAVEVPKPQTLPKKKGWFSWHR